METVENSQPIIGKVSQKEILLFNAICQLIDDLYSVFGDRFKSVGLYKRLVSHTTFSDVEPIRKHISAFEVFINNNKNAILGENLSNIPREEKISYSDRIYIEIQHFIHLATNEQRHIIGQHLLNLYALFHPKDETALATLQNHSKPQTKSSKQEEGFTSFAKNIGYKSETKEGKLIGNLLDKTMSAVSNTGGSMDMSGMMMNLLGSGILSDLQGGIGKDIENGNINPKKLMKEVGGFVSALLGRIGDDEEEEQPSTQPSTHPSDSIEETPSIPQQEHKEEVIHIPVD